MAARPEYEMSESVKDARMCTVCNKMVKTTDGKTTFNCGHQSHVACLIGDVANGGCDDEGIYYCKRCNAKQLQLFAQNDECDAEEAFTTDCDTCGHGKKKKGQTNGEFDDDVDCQNEYVDTAIQDLDDQDLINSVRLDKNNRISVFFAAGHDLAYLRRNNIAHTIDDLANLGFSVVHLANKERAPIEELAKFDGVSPVSLYSNFGITAKSLKRLNCTASQFSTLGYRVEKLPTQYRTSEKSQPETLESCATASAAPALQAAPVPRLSTQEENSYRERMRARMLSAQKVPAQQVDEYDDTEHVEAHVQEEEQQRIIVSNAFQYRQQFAMENEDAINTVYVQDTDDDYEEYYDDEEGSVYHEMPQESVFRFSGHSNETYFSPGQTTQASKPADDLDLYLKNAIQSGTVVPRETFERVQNQSKANFAQERYVQNMQKKSPWTSF